MSEISRSICLKCRMVQKSCCIDRPRAPPTIEDIETIVSLGFELKDFAIAGEYFEKDIQDCDEWWKNSMIKIDDRLFKTNIMKKDNGHCFFLRDRKGCILADKRPFVCKIFPFWVDDNDEIIYEPTYGPDEESCYIYRDGTPVTTGIKLIQESEESIRLYFSKIKNDCVNNKEQHKKIILRLIK